MRILLINHYAGSTTHGMEYRPFYLAREWQGSGAETTIIAASFSHLRAKGPSAKRGLEEERVENLPYVWLKTPRYQGNGLSRVLNMLAFTGQLFRYEAYLVQKCRPDVVITTSTYPLANVPACRIARRSHAKFVYEVRDLWPLTLVELGAMPRWHPFILLMQWAEDLSYRMADHVVSTLPHTLGYMREHGLAAGKFSCIPNGVAVEEWERDGSLLPEEHVNTLSSLRAQGKLVLGYGGSHGVSNALEPFLDAAARLQQQSVTFAFVGQGPEKEALRRRAACQKLTNVVFLPPVPRASVAALLAQFDACFIGWQNKPLYRFGISPNKLLDYMMAGKPVIQAGMTANDLVAESKCGLSVASANPQAIAEAVTRLAGLSSAEREAMGQRGKRYVQTHHDYRVLARQYLELLQSHNSRTPSLMDPMAPPSHEHQMA